MLLAVSSPLFSRIGLAAAVLAVPRGFDSSSRVRREPTCLMVLKHDEAQVSVAAFEVKFLHEEPLTNRAYGRAKK
jgi:hypothetical protein